MDLQKRKKQLENDLQILLVKYNEIGVKIEQFRGAIALINEQLDNKDNKKNKN